MPRCFHAAGCHTVQNPSNHSMRHRVASARAENGRRLKLVAEQIEQLEGRWLELSTQLDTIAESVD